MYTQRFFKGDKRTTLVKKNIAGSFIIKGWNSTILLFLVPLTMQCLTQYEYGIWLTINSILIWIDQFDIGFGNGLRNKLAEAMANNDKRRAKELTSTTFFMLFLIMIPLVGLLLLTIHSIDCYHLFNASPILLPNLQGTLEVLIALVGATFIFKFIGNIYLGLQLPAINNLLIAIGRTLSLILIAILAALHDHSFSHVAIAYTISPLIIYIVSFPVTFHYYPYLLPSIFSFRKVELHHLFSLGIKFFLVQISGAILFASSNLVISNTISPMDVVPYQISYYYFSVPLMIFSIIISPIWSATTDAYTKREWNWISRMEHKMRLIIFGMIGCILVMIFIAPWIYEIWIGNKIIFNPYLTIGMAIYITIIIFSLCYSNILNGIGKIWLLTIVTVIEAICFLPLAFYLGKQYGVIGIIGALIIVNSLCAITNYIQFKKLSNQTATDIWNI